MIKFFLIRDDIEDEGGTEKDGNYLDDLITFKFFGSFTVGFPCGTKILGRN